MTSQANRDDLFGPLRAVALVAALTGGAGSVALMLRAGGRNGILPVLVVLFTIWVLLPFIALLWANLASKGWSVVTRLTLHCLTLVLALGSLTIYSEVIALRPRGAPNAFLFVVVPPVSLASMAVVLSMAALMSRKRSRPDAVP